MYIRHLAFLQGCLLNSFTRRHLRKPKLNKFIGIKLNFTKFVCAAIVCCARKSSMHIQKKRDLSRIIFKKNFRALQVLINFYNCWKAPIYKNTIFYYGKNGGLVVHNTSLIVLALYQFSDLEFLLVENVGRQNFIDNSLSEEQKFWRISFTFRRAHVKI